MSTETSSQSDDLTLTLDKLTKYNTKKFIPPIENVDVKVIAVYDGDTITIGCLFFDSAYQFKVRIKGIDTPEIRTRDAVEKQYAKHIRKLLLKKIMTKNVVLKDLSYDKYGRILAEVFCEDVNIGQWLIENRLAVQYGGGKKKAFDKTSYDVVLE